MIPNSLRFRLPLTYAAIALVATLVLGAVLLLTLQQFYRQQELDYLTGNAFAIGERVLPLVRAEDAGQLQANVEGMAFLSQTRVQVFGADKSQVLADSGNPREVDSNTEIVVSVEIDGVEQTFNQTVAENASTTNQVTETTIVIGPGLFGSVDEDVQTNIVEESIDFFEDGSASSEFEERDDLGVITRTTIITQETQMDVLPVIGTQFGFGFGDGVASDNAVSTLRVSRPIEDENGRLIGNVELSQGPAYGRDIFAKRLFWLAGCFVGGDDFGWLGGLVGQPAVGTAVAHTHERDHTHGGWGFDGANGRSAAR